MPKLKSHSGAKKRFNLTKNGKVKRAHAFKSHILTKKTTKRTRNLRKNSSRSPTGAPSPVTLRWPSRPLQSPACIRMSAAS